MAPQQSTLANNAPPFPITSNAESPMQKKRSYVVASCPEQVATPTKRENTLIELNEAVPQVSVQFFVGENGILPVLPPDITLESVIKNLKDEQLVRDPKSSTRRRWKCFDKDPSAYSDKEDVVFRRIEDITEAIATAANTKRKPLLNFKCNPSMSPSSSRRNNDSRPDCYGLFTGGPEDAFVQKKPHWVNVGVPGEFKKSKSDEIDNWSKVLWSINYTMQEDPRRRFVYAFTIENTDMRIWVATRTEVLVSLPFDFNRKYEHTVEFFLRLMYAEEQQVGWDTTMVSVKTLGQIAGPVQYIIECAGTKYKTVELISDIGAEAIRGRGTRVWEVREIKANGEEGLERLVLKDSWVDSSRLREGEILEKIRADAIRTGTLDDFEGHFMKVKAYGDVHIGSNRDLDHTHSLILRGHSSTKQRKLLRVPVDPGPRRSVVRSNAGASGMPRLPEDPVRKILRYEPKVHHRIVYEEIGSTIAEVDTLSGALSVLVDAVKGLEVLHRCGWVHRDISTGNVLVVNGVGKLSDLEYAKRESDSQTHGVRTGTPYFISTEVEGQIYLHKPIDDNMDEFLAARKANQLRNTKPPKDAARKHTTASKDLPLPPPTQKAAPSSDPEARPVYNPDQFRHNPLHDLESSLWLGSWLLICSKFVLDPASEFTDENWKTYTQRHAQCAQAFFRDEVRRRDIMSASSAFLLDIAPLLPQVCDVGVRLNSFRKKLLKQYIVAYNERRSATSQPPFATMAGTLHADLTALLRASIEELTKNNTDLRIDAESRIRERVKKGRMPAPVPSNAGALHPSESAEGEAGPPKKKPKRDQRGTVSGPAAAGPSTGTRSRIRNLRLNLN